MEIKEVLLRKVRNIMEGWEDHGIYAVSFWVDFNEDNTFRGVSNVSEWMVSCNREEDCEDAGPLDEEHWNYAFWNQEEEPVITASDDDPEMALLFDWYHQQGLTHIGSESEDGDYDEEMNYVGKGPEGHYQLLMLAAEVARRLQEEGFLEKRFHKKIPIIVHGLEYAWYDLEATKLANPHGEAEAFLEYVRRELEEL